MSRLEISELGLLFKSLSGFCGQGVLSLGYYLRGILRKTGTGCGVWLLRGFAVPDWRAHRGKTGAGFGSECWPGVRVPFGCKELMWDLRMGSLQKFVAWPEDYVPSVSSGIGSYCKRMCSFCFAKGTKERRGYLG